MWRSYRRWSQTCHYGGRQEHERHRALSETREAQPGYKKKPFPHEDSWAVAYGIQSDCKVSVFGGFQPQQVFNHALSSLFWSQSWPCCKGRTRDLPWSLLDWVILWFIPYYQNQIPKLDVLKSYYWVHLCVTQDITNFHTVQKFSVWISPSTKKNTQKNPNPKHNNNNNNKTNKNPPPNKQKQVLGPSV